jgi:hypothetical protein
VYRPPVARSRLVLAGIVVVALGVAWLIRWGTDDAYISFVYARGLVRGEGLTAQPGDRAPALWLPMFLGYAARPIPELDVVAAPLDDRRALVMW